MRKKQAVARERTKDFMIKLTRNEFDHTTICVNKMTIHYFNKLELTAFKDFTIYFPIFLLFCFFFCTRPAFAAVPQLFVSFFLKYNFFIEISEFDHLRKNAPAQYVRFQLTIACSFVR